MEPTEYRAGWYGPVIFSRLRHAALWTSSKTLVARHVQGSPAQTAGVDRQQMLELSLYGAQPVQHPLQQCQVRTVAGLGRPVDDH